MRNKDTTDTPKVIIMILTISAVSFFAGYYVAVMRIAAFISTQLN